MVRNSAARRLQSNAAKDGAESSVAHNAKRGRELDMLDTSAALPKNYVPPPPPPPSHSAKASNVATLPIALAATFGLLLYGSYKAMNTAKIRLIMEDHAPQMVVDLEARGLLQPFSEVVVAINRQQLAERIYVVLAETDDEISVERVMLVAKAIGSKQFEDTVRSVLDARGLMETDRLTCDQFIACFAQATADVADDAMYFAVRNTFDIVPVPRKVKAMLSNLHDQCMLRRATFVPGEVRELCDKLGVAFQRDEESPDELAQMVHKHAFIDYFARKFEGMDVATLLVQLKAVLLYAATHPGSAQSQRQ